MDETGTTPQAIRHLTRIGALRDQEIRTEIEIRQEVAQARLHGSSWRMLGVALGTSTQAAWERFRPAAPARPLPGQGQLLDVSDVSDDLSGIESD